LFNDRCGLGRVYVSEGAHGLLFSSEAKSILKVRAATRQLDPASLGEWLSCGCVLQNRTLFAGISLLPPASAWTFRPGAAVAKSSYFDAARWEGQPLLSEEHFYSELRETFPRVLRRYFGGRQQVAMSLTGGVDGRMIMAWSPRAAGELPCYTFNGPIRDCADVRIARRVAESCGQPHRTIPLGDSFFPSFTDLAKRAVMVTDGAMDVTGAAELHVNSLAREIAPVRLTGNYGSETVRGNVAFRPQGFAENVLSDGVRRQVDAAAGTYARESAGHRLSFIAFKQVPWHHFSRFAVERSQLTIRSPFLDRDLLALLYRAPSSVTTSIAPSLRLIAEGNPRLGAIPTDRGLAFNASGVTGRSQRFVQDFLAKAEYAYDYGMPDWLARVDRVLSPLHLERLFLGRQKFCHFRTWYRNSLAPQIKDVLLDPVSRTRPHLTRGGLEAMIERHVAGLENHTTAIHKLLSLEFVHRTLLAA
jgi:asparagine synthase (glutamine-hydrolysing)